MTFSYENFSSEVDNTDVAKVKEYERCLEEFYMKIAKIDMKDTASGIYSSICSAGREMMDSFFGEGAARDMFGESQSVRKVMAAVCGLNRYMNDVSGVVMDMKELGI